MSWKMISGVVTIAVLVVSSCATRTPEEPTGNRGTYEPPTSPQIVIENFRNAVIEKNTQNFMLCLADPTRSRATYVFEPSAEVGARFQAIFQSWSLNRERQAFISLIARLPTDVSLGLEFTNGSVAFSSPDSLVWVGEYRLSTKLDLAGVPNVLTGTMVLSIQPEASGLWSIARWGDAKRTADTLESTWSILKAQLSN